MALLDALISAFLKTFGITQPGPEARRRASWFILALLLATLLVITAGAILLYRMLHA